jgi:hypothetical protein
MDERARQCAADLSEHDDYARRIARHELVDDVLSETELERLIIDIHHVASGMRALTDRYRASIDDDKQAVSDRRAAHREPSRTSGYSQPEGGS